jgi:hypothetical protein
MEICNKVGIAADDQTNCRYASFYAPLTLHQKLC